MYYLITLSTSLFGIGLVVTDEAPAVWVCLWTYSEPYSSGVPFQVCLPLEPMILTSCPIGTLAALVPDFQPWPDQPCHLLLVLVGQGVWGCFVSVIICIIYKNSFSKLFYYVFVSDLFVLVKTMGTVSKSCEHFINLCIWRRMLWFCFSKGATGSPLWTICVLWNSNLKITLQ